MEQHRTVAFAICTIRIDGHLDQHWSDWFDGMAITHESGGTTCLVGPIADQAALYGLIGKARDLSLTLLSIELHPSEAIRDTH
jgi:hypothetical protein